jgi:hypothetical protein
MKVLILVIASRNEVNEQDRLWQLHTWANQDLEDISILWLRGWNEDHYLLSDRELFVPCKEEYGNILEKTILGVNFVLEHMSFDVLIRSNVSTYFDLVGLKRELSRNQFKKDFYGGYVDMTNGSYFGLSQPFEYLSGTGIFMSRPYAQRLSTLNSKDFDEVPDDVAISEFFKSVGLRRIRMKRNNLSSTHIFLPTFHIRAKSSTDSGLAGKRMVLLYRYFGSKAPQNRIRVYISILIMEFGALLRHPESIRLYLLRNRVVLSSYIRMRAERIFE